MVEQERVVDFAGARLVAARIVGKLDMGDPAEILLDGAGEIALHHLHVVDVVLDEDVVRAGLLDDRHRLLGAVVRKKPGMSRVLIGSISSLMPGLFELVGGELEIARRRSRGACVAIHALPARCRQGS